MKKQLELLNQLIVNGELSKAQQKIFALNWSQVPRAYINDLARLAIRVGSPSVALKLLNPIVRPEKGIKKIASQDETLTYASALARTGAIKESQSQLQMYVDQDVPKALLYQAYNHVYQWEYDLAIPLFLKAFKVGRLSEYETMVNTLNLVSCRIFNKDFTQATREIGDIEKFARGNEMNLLLSNCLECKAQIDIGQNRFNSALKNLREAKGLLSDDLSIFSYFIKKWEISIRIKSEGPSRKNLIDLKSVRDAGVVLRHWESVRECDYLKATTTGNKQLALRLYFGTPYENYRKKVKNEFPGNLNIPQIFERRFGEKIGRVLDVRTGELLGTEIFMKPGQIQHKILNVLSSDFYKPFQIGHIFSQVFPNEFFNPLSSPYRIHQGMRRLRLFLKDNRIPLIILEKNETYFLTTSGKDFSFKISLDSASPSKNLIQIKRLQRHFRNDHFTSAEACEYLGESRSGTQTILNWALQSNMIVKLGRGRQTRYSMI